MDVLVEASIFMNQLHCTEFTDDIEF
jgi:hypothetical protein